MPLVTKTPPHNARLFIALWPDDAVRAACVAQRAACSWPAHTRIVAGERLHLTLHFLGDLPRHWVATLAAGLAGVAFAPFTLRLDQAQLWRGGVAVLLPGELPTELLRLHADLGVWLSGFGLTLERRAYRPHVTLARQASAAQLVQPATPIAWVAQRPRLVESGLRGPGAYCVLD